MLKDDGVRSVLGSRPDRTGSLGLPIVLTKTWGTGLARSSYSSSRKELFWSYSLIEGLIVSSYSSTMKELLCNCSITALLLFYNCTITRFGGMEPAEGQRTLNCHLRNPNPFIAVEPLDLT